MEDIEIIVTPINIDINAIDKIILLIGYHSSLMPSIDNLLLELQICVLKILLCSKTIALG
jgi:hypothetical protein